MSTTVGASSADAVATASTSSAPPPPSVAQFFQALDRYVTAEASLQSNDWSLVADCNAALDEQTLALKERVADAASAVTASGAQLHGLMQNLTCKVDEVDCSLTVLEGIVKALDAYSRTLEKAFCH
jgi:hypothetical protein